MAFPSTGDRHQPQFVGRVLVICSGLGLTAMQYHADFLTPRPFSFLLCCVFSQLVLAKESVLQFLGFSEQSTSLNEAKQIGHLSFCSCLCYLTEFSKLSALSVKTVLNSKEDQVIEHHENVPLPNSGPKLCGF